MFYILSKFLSNEDLIRRPIILYYCQRILFTLRVSSLLSPLNDASGDIVDEEASFQFSPEAEFTSPLYVHITLATNTEAESPCFKQTLQC